MRHTIIVNRLDENILARIKGFLNAASQIDGVSVDEKTFSVIFESEKEDEILDLSKEYKIADLTWIKI